MAVEGGKGVEGVKGMYGLKWTGWWTFMWWSGGNEEQREEQRKKGRTGWGDRVVANRPQPVLEPL